MIMCFMIDFFFFPFNKGKTILLIGYVSEFLLYDFISTMPNGLTHEK